MSIVPDYKPKNLSDKIEPKCLVVFFPIQLCIEVSNDHCGTDGVDSLLKATSASADTGDNLIPVTSSKNELTPLKCMNLTEEVQVYIEEHSSMPPIGDLHVLSSHRDTCLQTDKVLHIVWPHRW